MKIWYIYIYISHVIYIVEYYSAIKKNEIMPSAATWMNLEMIIKSEVNQTEEDKYMRVRLWRMLRAEELMLLNCGVGEDSWESLGLQRDPTSPFWRRSSLGFLWKEWCRSWNSSTLATLCKELTHWERLWCWEWSGAGGEGDDRGWDGWMASLTWWTWVSVNSGSWWWTGRPGVLLFMGLQSVGQDWVNDLIWSDLICGTRKTDTNRLIYKIEILIDMENRLIFMCITMY